MHVETVDVQEELRLRSVAIKPVASSLHDAQAEELGFLRHILLVAKIDVRGFSEARNHLVSPLGYH
jgi:hypothetical protein